MDDFQPGLQVTPTVRLVRPLAEGGMGKVWIAEHTGLSTEVVVKFLGKDFADNLEAITRFKREAAVAAAVKSPHVVQVLDYGVMQGGPPYIVMEHLEGRDLDEYLHKHGRMAPADVAAMVAQVAKGLGKAHEKGVVHRDIKPSNIFLCDGDAGEMFVKVLDFGVAKRIQEAGSKTTTGIVIGTPHYMSPEQIIADREIDPRTDIWALGVVAFQAMTGKLPFDGNTVGAITLAIHKATPKVTAFVPELPPAIDEWFAHVCAREPEQRYQTARDAAQALQHAITGAVAGPVLLAMPEPTDPRMSMASVPDIRHPVTSLSTSFPVSNTQRKGPPKAMLAVAGVALVGLIALTAVALSGRTSAPATASTSAPPSVVPAASEPPTPAPTPSESASTEESAASSEPAPAASTPAKPAATAKLPTIRTRPTHTTTKKHGNDDDIK